MLEKTRNMFCRTRSLSNATFSFLITWRSPSSKSAAVYKISWKSDDFSLRYGDVSIFKMAAVRHLGMVLPPYETTHEVSVATCWPQLAVKFHVNLKYRSEDIAIWIFRIFCLKCLFRAFQAPKWGFGWLWTPKCDYSSSRPPKGTSLRKSASFKLSTAKIHWGVWPVGELTESVMDTRRDRQTHTHAGKFIFSSCTALDRQIRS